MQSILDENSSWFLCVVECPAQLRECSSTAYVYQLENEIWANPVAALCNTTLKYNHLTTEIIGWEAIVGCAYENI